MESLLTALPIRRKAKLPYLAFIGAIFGSAMVILPSLLTLPPGAKTLGGILQNAPALLICPLVPMIYILVVVMRKAVLEIDQTGVRLSLYGRQRSVAWVDLASVEGVKSTRVRGALRLVRRGELTNNPKPFTIPPDFGFAPNELKAILNAGLAAHGAKGDSAGGKRASDLPEAATSPKAAWQGSRLLGVVIFGAIYAFIIMIIGLMTMPTYFKLKHLEERGIATTATVKKLYFLSSRGSRVWHVQYTYHLSQANSISGDDKITDIEYLHLSVGDKIRIVYDPRDIDASEQIINGNLKDNLHSSKDFLNSIWKVISTLGIWVGFSVCLALVMSLFTTPKTTVKINLTRL